MRNEPLIIGISGKKRSGKDTAAKFIQEYTEYTLNLQIGSFAYNVRVVASVLTGIPLEEWLDDSIKDRMLDDWGVTGRVYLQQLATEALRDNFYDDIWVKSFEANRKPGANYIIADLRFINEVEYIKSKGGILLRVEPSYPGYVNTGDTHISETELDFYDGFDAYLLNDGTPEKFFNNIRKEFDSLNKVNDYRI